MDQSVEASPAVRESARSWLWGRKLWVLVVVFVLAGTGVWVQRATAVGPLGHPPDGGGIVGMDEARVGETLSFGSVVVRNHGTSAVTLRSATLVGEIGSLTVKPALVAGPERNYGIGAGRGPLPSVAEFGVRPVPLAGATVQPSSAHDDPGVEIIVQVVPTDKAFHRFTGVRIKYEYRGRTYTYTDPIGYEICPTTTCPEPDDET